MERNIGVAGESLRVNTGLIAAAVGLYVALQISVLPGFLLLLAGVLWVAEAFAGWSALKALLGRKTR